MQKARRRKLGVLKDLMSERDLAALEAVIEKPLSAQDQAALEGNETDGFGILRRRGIESMRPLRDESQ